MEARGERVVEVIKEGEILRVPVSKAIEEDLFILRSVIEPEKEVFVSSDLRRTESKSIQPDSKINHWKAGKATFKRSQVLGDLTDNFHWKISKTRRDKNISRRQLADAIGATELDIRTIELGELPRDDFVIINRIENHLGISLRKEKKPETNLADLQKLREENEKKGKAETSKASGKNVIGNDIEIVE